eukprot:5276831-Prymnesium_polylepis.2
MSESCDSPAGACRLAAAAMNSAVSASHPLASTWSSARRGASRRSERVRPQAPPFAAHAIRQGSSCDAVEYEPSETT